MEDNIRCPHCNRVIFVRPSMHYFPLNDGRKVLIVEHELATDEAIELFLNNEEEVYKIEAMNCYYLREELKDYL